MRLPNGSTANISPQVISPGCSPALGGVHEQVLPQAAGVRVGRLDAGVLLAHRVGDHVAHRRLVEPGRRRAGCRSPGCRSPGCAARRSGRWRRRRSPGRRPAGATPMFLATRVAPPAQATSPPLTISWSDRVAGAGVDPLGDRGCGRASGSRPGGCGRRSSRRRSCPGAGRRCRGSGRPTATPAALPMRVDARRRALVDDDDLDLHALRLEPLATRP